MKKGLLLVFAWVLFVVVAFAQTKPEIKFKVKGATRKYALLAYYYGDKQYIKDSARVANDGSFTFKADSAYHAGIYMVVYTPDMNYFDILINEGSQRFSIETTVENPVKDATIIGSADNRLFFDYSNYLSAKKAETKIPQSRYAIFKDSNPDSAKVYAAKLKKIDKEVVNYKDNIRLNNPNTFLAFTLNAMWAPEVPVAPKNIPDSATYVFYVYRSHYWDKFPFLDKRIVYTPIISNKINEYLDKTTVQDPDSIIESVKFICNKLRPNKEAYKFAVTTIINKYANMNNNLSKPVYAFMVYEYYVNNKAWWIDKDMLENMITSADKINKDLPKKVENTVSNKNVKQNTKPPLLNIAKQSIKLSDDNNNNAIDGLENCMLTFELSNNGAGNATKMLAKISATGNKTGLTINDVYIATLNAGEKKRIEIPIQAGYNVENGTVTFTLKVDEPNGFGTDEYTIEIPTRRFISPLVEVVDYTVTGSNGNNLKKKTPFDLQVLVQNTQQGPADDVKVTLQVPANVLCVSGNESQNYATLKAGETKSIVYSLIVSDLYMAETIPVTILLTEKIGKYAQNKNIQLTLNQALAADKVTLTATGDNTAPVTIAKGSLNADVDVNIPTTSTVNAETFVVIIANENYADEAKVDHAINDGTVFKSYCEKTLGIPTENIHFVKNATYGKLIAEKAWLANNLKAYKGQAKAIFYYAGHGIPGGQDQPAYLLPVDGSSADVTSALKLDDLYATITENPSKGVTVLLDACFSGSTRDAGMLASARGTKLKPRESTLRGNMVVFSAASGDETAWPYADKQHGMFTYYLLKKLQENKGDVSYKDLADYIADNVYKTAIKLNNKPQTPTTKAGSAVSGWESWKLK